MNKFLAVLILGLATTFAFAQSGPDTYVYQTFGGIDTLDPEGAYDTASGTALENIYETLYSYAGESITEYEAALATDYEVSEDGLTYTYTLREGVKFHSGNDFTCRDVEYSLERILVMNDPSSGVWFQAEAFLGNNGSNANDDETITWEMIDNAITCVDDLTVQFNLPKVDPAFFVKLLYTNASIVDSAWAIENGEWDGTEDTWRDWVGVDPREGFLHTNASGTGAYSLVSWDGTNLVAEAFGDYWGGEPTIKTVLYQTVDELATRILNLQNGDADRIALGSDTDWATLETQIRGLDGVAIYDDPSWISTAAGAIHFKQDVVVEDNEANVGSGQLDGAGIPSDFFNDVNVRKGFSYVFDPNVLIDDLYLGNGQILTMALPPSFLGYDDSVPTYSYDPELAEEAFRAAFDGELWETGFEMTIAYNEGNTIRQTIAEVFKANLEDLNPNFKVDIRGMQWPDFLEQRNQGNLAVSIVGWAPDYADPDNFMYTFYNSNGYYGAQLGFADDEIDGLIENARATTVASEREGFYTAAATRAFDLAPFLVYPTARVFIVASDQLQGVYRNPMYSGYFLWKDLSK